MSEDDYRAETQRLQEMKQLEVQQMQCHQQERHRLQEREARRGEHEKMLFAEEEVAENLIKERKMRRSRCVRACVRVCSLEDACVPGCAVWLGMSVFLFASM